MQISKQMVKYLLCYVTIGWFGDHEALAENTDDYAPYIADLRNVAERTNDLPWFKLGLEHLLTADDVSDVELVNMSSDEWAELKKSRAGG